MKEEVNYKIFKTDEYTELARLFDENGLHADPEEERDLDSIALWRCETEEGELIAGAELIYRANAYVLQHIAVADKYKGQGFGAKLLAVVEDEVQERIRHDNKKSNATCISEKYPSNEMWLCAKVPEFYKKFGWKEVDGKDAPNFSSCFECEDFGTICNPKVMRKDFLL